jgi:Nucleotidyl transferase AbiEii toxin, Type IV TA system
VPSPASPIGELLAAVRAALEPLGIRWYLFGAQAAILYGAARLTADVDITLDPGPHPVEDVLAALEARRFAPRVDNAVAFVTETRVLPMVHGPTRIPVDLVLAGPGPEERFLQHAEVRLVDGVPVPVAAPDDLVVMKVLAGRPQDLEDVVAIIAAQGPRVDLERATATLRLLEQALDRRDLSPRLEQAHAAARRGKGGSPTPSG